jgi:hypothetical protein
MSAIPGGSAVARSSYPGATSPHTPRYRSTIIGNLVEDPELRFTNTGIAVANLRVAVTQRVQQDGEWRDGDTSFLKVNVWRGQGRAGQPARATASAAPAGERAAERGGDFNETRPSDRLHPTASSAQPGAALSVRPRGAGQRSGLMQFESRRRASSER